MTSTPNDRKRRASAKRKMNERAWQCTPSMTIPRKGRVKTDGKSFTRAERDSSFTSGEAFTQDGKALGFMDARMIEHRSNSTTIRPMPTWINRETARQCRAESECA